jgi:hypothetical protein
MEDKTMFRRISARLNHTVIIGMIATAGLMTIILPDTARAEHSEGPFGIGIIVGEPTGIDAKFFLTGTNAIEAAVAWSLSGKNNLHLQAEYLYHRYDLIKVEKGQLPLFFGVGGRFIFRENAKNIVGVRIPVGLAYEFEGAPFDVFGEIVPIMDLTPDTEFDLEGASARDSISKDSSLFYDRPIISGAEAGRT